METEKSKIEETLWRSQLLLSTMKYVIDTSTEDGDLLFAEKYRSEAEKNIRESLIKLFAVSVYKEWVLLKWLHKQFNITASYLSFSPAFVKRWIGDASNWTLSSDAISPCCWNGSKVCSESTKSSIGRQSLKNSLKQARQRRIKTLCATFTITRLICLSVSRKVSSSADILSQTKGILGLHCSFRAYFLFCAGHLQIMTWEAQIMKTLEWINLTQVCFSVTYFRNYCICEIWMEPAIISTLNLKFILIFGLW